MSARRASRTLPKARLLADPDQAIAAAGGYWRPRPQLWGRARMLRRAAEAMFREDACRWVEVPGALRRTCGVELDRDCAGPGVGRLNLRRGRGVRKRATRAAS